MEWTSCAVLSFQDVDDYQAANQTWNISSSSANTRLYFNCSFMHCQCWALNVIGFVKQLETFLCSRLFVLHEGSRSYHSKIKADTRLTWKNKNNKTLTQLCVYVFTCCCPERGSGCEGEEEEEYEEGPTVTDWEGEAETHDRSSAMQSAHRDSSLQEAQREAKKTDQNTDTREKQRKQQQVRTAGQPVLGSINAHAVFTFLHV